MNKPYPGVLHRAPAQFETFVLEGALPTGTKFLVNWNARTFEVKYPEEQRVDYPKGTLGDALQNLGDEDGDHAFINPEPELPMERPPAVDPTKEKRYVVMDADGWSHAPNGTRFTNQQINGNSPLIILFKELEKLLAKVKHPVCCFAMANARGNPSISPTISGQLSNLFIRGVLRRKKYHCECQGCVDVSDGRTIYHYQMMPGSKK